MNVHELALATEGLDEAAFLERYKHSALVFLTETSRLEDTPAHDTVRPMTLQELLARSKGLRMTDPIPTPGSSTSPTQTGSNERHDEVAITPASTIFFVEKSNRNPFGSMITVGRATNNDVVLPLRTISKMHSYFMQTGAGWKITDQHSANGTFVDALKLPDGQGALLSDGARIGFGNEAQCRFYTPSGLWKLIESYRGYVVRANPSG
jgi:hypothetical protein